MTAARKLTESEERIAEAVIEKLLERGLVRARPQSATAAPVRISDTDRALARKYARRLGLRVTTPKR